MLGSLWYHQFNISMKYRMGAIWKPDKGFSVKLLLEMLRRAEETRSMCDSLQEKHVSTVFVTYAVVSYMLSFRGNKGFLLDLKGTRENWDRRDNKVFWIVLRGKLKGEHVDAIHFVPCTQTTSSGIKVGQVVRRLVEEKEKLGWIIGPAITNHQDQFYSSREMA